MEMFIIFGASVALGHANDALVSNLGEFILHKQDVALEFINLFKI